MIRSPSWLRRNEIIAGAIFAACMAIYLPTMSPSVVADDGGEFQTLAAVLGVPHPTGYPLFTLLGWVFTKLPLGGDPAYRVTLLGAIATAAAMALLYLTARELGAGRLPAASAALLTAAAPRIWLHATAAEAHGLANLFLLLGLWLLLRWGAGKTPLWAAALAFGFGLTHHISLRLFAPAVLLYIFLVAPRLVWQPKIWLPALACLLLPLTLYAYIPLRAAYFQSLPELSGEVLGIRKVVAAGYISPHYFGSGPIGLILAMRYSGSLFSSGIAGWEQIARYLAEARAQFSLPLLPLSALGIVILARHQRKTAALFLVGYVTVLLLALQYLSVVREDGDSFIPTHLLLALWLAVGLEAAVAWLTTRLHAWPWHRALLAVGLCALPLASIAARYPTALAARQVDVAQGVLDDSLPPGAVLAGNWHAITPLWYRQRVEGVRPDVWVVQADRIGTRKLLGKALAEGTPFYTIRPTPAGVRLLPVPPREPKEIARSADVPFKPHVHWHGYALDPRTPRPGEVLHITFYWRATRPIERDWTTFIHLLDERGEKVAQTDRVPVGDFYPPSAWQPGVLLADQYELLPPRWLRPGRYRLIFGCYDSNGRLPWVDGHDVRPLTDIVIAPRPK